MNNGSMNTDMKIKGGYMMKLEDIVIPKRFLKTPPKFEKVDQCRKIYAEIGQTGHTLVVNRNNVLIDGYIGYIVLKENNVENVYVEHTNSYKHRETLYVYAHHPNNSEVYMWRVKDSMKYKGLADLVEGKVILVESKSKITPAIVVKTELLDECPRKGFVKKVVGWK